MTNQYLLGKFGTSVWLTLAAKLGQVPPEVRVRHLGRLRGRGVTFVGQTESGTIQVIANEDADLGLLPFLRLYAVGVVEDQPIHHGSCFLNLEIVE